MNIDEFWEIIDAAHRGSDGNMDRKCQLLKERLSALDPQDLRDFIDHFDVAHAAAYTWPLWGAAYVMRGGCSDDSFSDFRATLISQGRAVFDRALADPESLAELDFDDDEDICYEGFQYVKDEVARETLGELPERTMNCPNDPAGEEWEEATVDQLYPKLAAKYSRGQDGDDSPSQAKPWWKLLAWQAAPAASHHTCEKAPHRSTRSRRRCQSPADSESCP